MANTGKTSCCERWRLQDNKDIAGEIIKHLATYKEKTLFIEAFHAMPAKLPLRITKDTMFAGIRRVLDKFSANIQQLEITCPYQDTLPIKHQHLSALAVLMGMVPSDYVGLVASNCCWEGITKVTIQGSSLRCLVPQFIAISCPQLTHLKIFRAEGETDSVFTDKPADALPLPLCSSLTHLEFDVDSASILQLPPAYHSPAELRQSLPNINTLTFTECHNASIIEVFATQLTRLGVIGMSNEVGHQIRRCSNLVYLQNPDFILPDHASFLKCLTCSKTVADRHIQRLLQLPSLTTLHVLGFEHPGQDWSTQACAWQELHIDGYCDFTMFVRFNLTSLKELTMGPELDIILPDPSDPCSLTSVRLAASKLSHVGKIVLKESSENQSLLGNYYTINWCIPEGDEQGAVELFSIAAQRVKPCKIYDCERFLDRPLLLDAIFQWGQQSIEKVYLGKGYDLQPQLLFIHPIIHDAKMKSSRYPVLYTKQHNVLSYPELGACSWVLGCCQ